MSIELSIRHRMGGFSLEVDFAVDKPGVTAIFGPSGAGKTTVIDAVSGLVHPDHGHIRVGGRTLLDTEKGINVPTRLRAAGCVFQDGRLFPHLNVKSNLQFGERRARGRPGHTTYREVVDLMGLEGLLDRRPGTLSGGERQRVALGRALLARPEVLLMDEPLAALDRERKEEIFPLLQRIRNVARIPVLYVSHAIDEVARLADEVVILRGGRVEATGSVFDVLARPDLFPNAAEAEAGAVVRARVSGKDAGLSMLEFDGGVLWVPAVPAGPGTSVRVRILARDVMLALIQPQAISANNVLSCRVTDIHAYDAARVDVQLECGSARLLSRITERSRQRLDIKSGDRVFAIIKSVAVDRPSRGRNGA